MGTSCYKVNKIDVINYNEIEIPNCDLSYHEMSDIELIKFIRYLKIQETSRISTINIKKELT